MFSDTNKLYCNTNSINKTKAIQAIKKLYSFCNTESYATDYWKEYTTARPSRDPDIIFADGPAEVVELFEKDDMELVDLSRFNDVCNFVNRRSIGSKERVRGVVGQVFSDILPYNHTPRSWTSPLFKPIDSLYNNDENSEWEKLASKVWDEVYVCFTYKNHCYVINRPSVVHTNDRGLHCKDGPAMIFRDGTKVYCYEGMKVIEENIYHPERMSLQYIHQSRRKHILIDLCGVDRYLEMCKSWKPDVKGKFAEFFHMSEMVVPQNPNAKSWERNGFGHLYVEHPSTIDFSHRTVNGKYSMVLEDNHNSIYAFADYISKHPFDAEYASNIFNKEDRELWDVLDVVEMMGRGASKFCISFQNGIFSLKSKQTYEGHAACHHDVAPAWFKSKMFRNEDAVYVNEELDYVVKYEDGKLFYSGNIEQAGDLTPKNEPSKPIKVRNSLFRGSENIPSYKFDIDFQSDSWEGLLEKWAYLSFNWLGMHENSTCLY